jgi:hypothetical protein
MGTGINPRTVTDMVTARINFGRIIFDLLLKNWQHRCRTELGHLGQNATFCVKGYIAYTCESHACPKEHDVMQPFA